MMGKQPKIVIFKKKKNPQNGESNENEEFTTTIVESDCFKIRPIKSSILDFEQFSKLIRIYDASMFRLSN